jgi:hypothetical protein
MTGLMIRKVGRISLLRLVRRAAQFSIAARRSTVPGSAPRAAALLLEDNL